jgi:hypothetical protein
MAQKDEAKKFGSAPVEKQVLDAPLESAEKVNADLEGIEMKVQKVLSSLIERIMILEAKCASMPLNRPVVLPQKENYNTDFVAGM